jgi:hypothetical protein
MNTAFQQLNILDAIAEGEKLRDAGIELATESANNNEPGWKEKAWSVFFDWLGSKPIGYSFMMEDFRLWTEIHKTLTVPPSKRAFGFIPSRAARQGMVFQRGTSKVKNSTAHCANAAVWVKI